MESSLENRNRLPLAQQVADQISQMIVEKNLLEGQQIPSEFEIAEQLNVGRGTVREAVKILVARNVVEIRRGRGTFVVYQPGVAPDPLGLSFIKDQAVLAKDLLVVRLQIEPWCAAVAAQNATVEQVEQMQGLCQALETIIPTAGAQKSDAVLKQRIETDIQLHTLIAQSSGNLVMPRLIPVICEGVELFSLLSGERKNANKIAIATHWGIVNAIANHDAEAARQAMYYHLIQNQESVDQYARTSVASQ